MNPHLEAGTLTKKWHMAYHGSNVAAVRRVLDRGELGAGTITTIALVQSGQARPMGHSRISLTQFSSQGLPPS